MEAMELQPMLVGDAIGAKHTTSNASEDFTDDAGKDTTTNTATKTTSISYCQLLRGNRPFTLYLLSYITNHAGEWLTYLASLTALHEMTSPPPEASSSTSPSSSSSTLIGAMVAVRLTANVIVSPWGGALADAVDRRRAMIALDLVGASTAFVFVGAAYARSPALIFVATAVQEIESGLYEPSRSAMVPMLCRTSQQLGKATLLTGMAWSTVAALGSATGGVLVSWLGMQGCFLVDCATYLVSAWLMTCVDGNYSVATETQRKNNTDKSVSAANTTAAATATIVQQSTESPWSMVVLGWTYLRKTSWGPLVLLKFSGLWLTMDVLMVDFADRGDDPGRAPMRMGALFGAVGVGCLIGPPLVDQFTSLQRPVTVQVAAIVALGLSATACGLISLNLLGNPLWLLCCLTVLRSCGVSVLWIQATLLLQELSDPAYLGRVLSMDYGLALLGEASNALITGRLRDAAHWSPERVCAWLAAVGFLFTVSWTAYTYRGGGAMGLPGTSSDRPGKDNRGEALGSSDDRDDTTNEDEDTDETEMSPFHKESRMV